MRTLFAQILALCLPVVSGPAAALSPAARAVVTAPGYASDTRAILAAFTTPASPVRARLIDRTVRAEIACGAWGQVVDTQFMTAAHSQQAALTDWRKPSRQGVLVSTPAFVVDRGFTAGAAAVVNTNFTPSTDAVTMTATRAWLGVYERTNSNATTNAAGAGNADPSRFTITPRRSTANSIRSGVMTAITSGVVAITDSRGFSASAREGTSTLSFEKDGAVLETISATPSGGSLPTVPVYIGAENNSGSISSPRTTEIAAFVAGGSGSLALRNCVMRAVQAYMAGVGATAP